jgi:GT2 family glycosyltransferase
MLRFSVIVPSYNAAPLLRRLLETLKQQDRDDFEVVVVDDASTDDTAAMVAAFAPFRYHRLEVNSGPAAARNEGARLAAAPFLVFTDADTEFLPDTLSQIARALDPSGADALVGTYSEEPASRGFMPRYKALWEHATIVMPARTDGHGIAPIATWAPRAGVVRKEAFDQIGGFDTRFRGADLEDMELGYRLHAAGFTIRLATRVVILHHYPGTLRVEMRAFARRVALWMGMFAGRVKMDDTGEGDPRQALADLAGFGAFLALWPALLWPWAALVAALLFCAFWALSWTFFKLCLDREGPVFALRALAVRWLHVIVMGFAVAYGLAFCRRRM